MNKAKPGFKNLYLPIFFILFVGIQILTSCSSDENGEPSSSSSIYGDSSSSGDLGGNSSSSVGDGSSSSVEDGSSSSIEEGSSSSVGDDLPTSSSSDAVIDTSSSSSVEPSSSSAVPSSSSGGISSSFIDKRDGKTYRSVTIGTQIWMAENLNYEAEGSICYSNEPSNCTIYGRMYDWAKAMTVCPEGWHLPNSNEWNTMTSNIGGSSGKKLKATSGWNNKGNGSSGNGTDEYGFSALPGGISSLGSSFSYVGFRGYWWTASEYSTGNAYYRKMYEDDDNVISDYSTSNTISFMSVRCVKDGDEENSSSSVVPSSSSVVPSSSSVVPSSSSAVPSSSSVAPSSSSLVQSSSSLVLSSSSSTNVVYGDSVTYGYQTYPTVVIGTQTWFAKNLNYNFDGSRCYGEGGKVLINKATEITLSDSQIQENCNKYGRLYNWATAMNLESRCNNSDLSNCQVQSKHQGICPEGWHIPSLAEWEKLRSYVLAQKDCSYCDASYLKATSGWNSNSSSSGNGTDEYGFSALPGGRGRSGYSITSVSFDSVGYYGQWWSSSVRSAGIAYKWGMYSGMNYSYSYDDVKPYLFSVRCVKDD